MLRFPHRVTPGGPQLAMAITPPACYNLERNQLFNNPYESSSFLDLEIKGNGEEESPAKVAPNEDRQWNSRLAGLIWFVN
jgi:hypothetical protein